MLSSHLSTSSSESQSSGGFALVLGAAAGGSPLVPGAIVVAPVGVLEGRGWPSPLLLDVVLIGFAARMSSAGGGPRG